MESKEGIRDLPLVGKFSIEPNIGTSFSVGGDFVSSASETVSGSIVVGSSTLAGGIAFTTEQRDFGDVYEAPIKIGLNLNYALSKTSEIFGGVSYTRARGREFNAVDISIAGTIDRIAVDAGTSVTGIFDDFKEMALSGGYRHYFSISKKIKPYFSFAGSLKKSNDIKIDLTHKPTSISVNDVKFFGSSISYALGLNVGFRFDVSSTTTIGFETGLNFNSKLDSDDSDIAGGGSFSDTNNNGKNMEIPVMFRVNVAF